MVATTSPSSIARRTATGLVAVIAVLTWIVLTAVPASAVVGTYVVNSTGDEADAGTARNGLCATPAGACTLRAALAEADADRVASTVNFAIPGTQSQVHTIAIASRLDTLDEGDTTINGYSQPGSSPNTDPLVSNAAIKIQIEGAGASEAFVIHSPRNTLRGLAIYKMSREIRIGPTPSTSTEPQDADDNVLAGNFLGTNAAGTFGATTANNGGAFGVIIRQGSKRNLVGGPAPADRNVVSGHAGRAILIGVPGTGTVDQELTDNVVQNNLLGLRPNGLAALPNLGHAVDINNGASRNRVVGNVISGNGANSEGIEVSHGYTTQDNEIIDNKIGTNAAGTASPAYAANGKQGIRVEDGATGTVVRGNVVGNNGGGISVGSLMLTALRTVVENNFVGVTSTGARIPNRRYGIRIGPCDDPSDCGTPNQTASNDAEIRGNEVAYNPVGVIVDGAGSVRNTITSNSIHDNDGLGIDLAPVGAVNQNDAGDGDSGPNTLLNWPILTGATSAAVSGTSCAGCRVAVFRADDPATLDAGLATSYGEGEEQVATAIAASDGSFSAALPAGLAGEIVTATATDNAGNTSEFSLNLLVPAPK